MNFPFILAVTNLQYFNDNRHRIGPAANLILQFNYDTMRMTMSEHKMTNNTNIFYKDCTQVQQETIVTLQMRDLPAFAGSYYREAISIFFL